MERRKGDNVLMEETECQQLEDRLADLSEKGKFTASEIVRLTAKLGIIKRMQEDITSVLDAAILSGICTRNR